MPVYRRSMDDSNDYPTEWCASCLQNRNNRYGTAAMATSERGNVPIYERGTGGIIRKDHFGLANRDGRKQRVSVIPGRDTPVYESETDGRSAHHTE